MADDVDRPLSLDEDDVAEAIRTRDDFVIHAPLGWRGTVRKTIRALAAQQGRRVIVGHPWYGVVEPAEGENYGDYFYVIVTT